MTNWWRNLFMGKKRAASPDSRRYRPAVEPLESRTVPTVTYHGGALMPHVEAQAIYLGADWNNAALQPQTRTLDGFLASLVNGPYMDNLSMAGYGVGRGSANPGRVDPFILMAGYTLTDAAIQRDLQSAVTNGLVRSPDANRLYVVFVQPNVAVRASDGSVSRTDFLGYHGAFTGYDGTGHATNIRYAVIAYPGGTVNNAGLQGAPAIDDLTEVASHEIAEAVTDPDVDHSVIGWYDDAADGEVADLANLQWVALGGLAVQRIADKHDFAMTPAGATSLLPATFVLKSDGRLYEHSAQGWTFLCGGVASVSNQGIDNDGRAMVDVVLTSGLAYEYHNGFGWTFLQAGVKAACAGQGTSYILLRTGQLMEYRDGGGARTGALAQDVVAIDAGTDLYGVSSVDVVFRSGNFSIYSDSSGWRSLCGNVLAVSAGDRGVSGVLLRDGRAYEYKEAGGLWYFLGRDITQITAGFDSSGAAVLDTLSRAGTVREYHTGLVSQVVASHVKSIGAARGGVLDIVSINGSAYEHTAAGWRPLCAGSQIAA